MYKYIRRFNERLLLEHLFYEILKYANRSFLTSSIVFCTALSIQKAVELTM